MLQLRSHGEAAIGTDATHVMTGTLADALPDLPPDRPVLIAGPTASGKSALALAVAEAQARVVVNADALQVYDGWRVLTARPSEADLARAPHALYGHVPYRDGYSAGAWLRDVAPLLTARPAPVVVGGTGLYFAALTEGLADIPPTLPGVRAEADRLMATRGMPALLGDLDSLTLAHIDRRNPARVQRAWEVWRQTGRGLAHWQAATGPALLPPERAVPVVIEAGRDWLAARIDRRFDAMISGGALDEARAMADDWDPRRASSQAIGAAELVAVTTGAMDLEAAAARAKLASRQYAKRQRSWFRGRMRHWMSIPAEEIADRR